MNGIEKRHMKDSVPKFRVGDVVDVAYRIREGERERIQIFTGTVIARKHGGIRETATVRRIVAGEGVERTFPLHSPFVEGIEVRRHGKVRRAKLYYLRDRVGKATKVKERRVQMPKKAPRRRPSKRDDAPVAPEAAPAQA